MSDDPNSPLIKGVSQFEVDFVIPRLGVDLPLGIDPFLLFKSRDPELAGLHADILAAFNAGIEALRRGDTEQARYLLDFPEVSEIGLGNTKKGKRGSGVGTYLAELIIETLRDSPDLMSRGVRHIEEMQLVSAGIGPDRVSDIAANIVKRFLIGYTQKQCEIWKIRLASGVPIGHVLDPKSLEWDDAYYDLPLSPVDQAPILLVPRRMVRALPWISYQDFYRQEFTAYLRAKRVKGMLAKAPPRPAATAFRAKEEVAAANRADIVRIDRYVAGKEASAADAQPSLTYLDVQENCPEAEQLKSKLQTIPTGSADAAEYQRTVLAILNYLFSPELIDGELEVSTLDGTERRDIMFTNDSDRTFWQYVRQEHSGIFLMFEVKNTDALESGHYNQVATYMGTRLGGLAFIATRNVASRANQKKAFSIHNDSNPRKIILVLADEDMVRMLNIKCAGNDPMYYIQKLYRAFRTSVQ